jgi:hypothetical protein
MTVREAMIIDLAMMLYLLAFACVVLVAYVAITLGEKKEEGRSGRESAGQEGEEREPAEKA